jgi:hypothetical protein
LVFDSGFPPPSFRWRSRAQPFTPAVGMVSAALRFYAANATPSLFSLLYSLHSRINHIVIALKLFSETPSNMKMTQELAAYVGTKNSS